MTNFYTKGRFATWNGYSMRGKKKKKKKPKLLLRMQGEYNILGVKVYDKDHNVPCYF